MEVKYLLVLIVFFDCSTILLVASRMTSRVGRFRVLQKHPGMRKCASDILKQNGLVGGRVSNVTGVCEGLQQPWALNQTIQNGYSYLKTIHAKQKYSQPVGINEFPKAPGWLIPGVLHEGAEVEATILTDWLKPFPGFIVKLVDMTDKRLNIDSVDDWYGHSFAIWTTRESSTSDIIFGIIEKDPGSRYLEESKKSRYIKLEHSEVKKRKFTFHALADGFKCMFDGKVMYTYQHKNFDPKIMRQIYVQYMLYDEMQGDPVAVHNFEFRGHVDG